ncbi:unnamed protein product [Mucor hiemalis]
MDYQHRGVNHSEGFISEDGTHTNTIEGTWNGIKIRCFPRSRTRKNVPWVLTEFIWRRKHHGDLYNGEQFTQLFTNSSCKMIYKGNHTHGKYNAKHLTVEEKTKMDKKVEGNPHTKPSQAVVGISSRTGETIPPIYESISGLLVNLDRTKYELNNSRKRQNMSSRVSFLGEFEKIEEEYDDYIISAEVARKSFSIVFSAPEMTRFDLNFKDFPVITDVTYKAIKDDYYLCSSVMYVAHLRKHVVIFQAIIGGLSAKFFRRYFELFSSISIFSLLAFWVL